MTNTAIRVDNITKQYQIGTAGTRLGERTLREVIADATAAPARWLRKPQENGAGQETLWALKDVSFEVAPGEVVGIIGRNGAGKSTLLKVLSRIAEPTSGRVEIHGRVASMLEVGTGFHPELTGRENIFLNGAILGMTRSEIHQKLDEIVAFAELEKFLDTPVKRYSSGMYLRLAFAVAAHLEPEILVVDEVLAVGDAQFQKKCIGKMGDVASGGRTVLFVSHNMGAVNLLCNRVVFLAQGQVKAVGPTAPIVSDYLKDTLRNDSEDLSKLRLPGFGKDLRFVDIRLIGADDGNLLFGQPIQYALTLESGSDVSGLSIASSVFDMSGNCIGTLFNEQSFSLRAGQRLTVYVTVSRSNLAPGTYYSGFSVGRGGGTSGRNDLDIVIGKPAFQIIPVGQGDDAIGDWQPGWGSIVFKDVDVKVGEG
jgi:lipopolysaccharide transport system ATP-binding protein